MWKTHGRPWRGGRVVDGSGLENRRSESFRGFESHPLRFNSKSASLPERLVPAVTVQYFA